MFNGRESHHIEGFTGMRVSIIAYMHSAAENMDDVLHRQLNVLGFPHSAATNVAGTLAAMGASCTEFDDLHGESGNLADDCIWESLITQLKPSVYHRKVGGPPCSTFLAARLRRGGPRALRTPSGPGRYGMPGLKPEEKEAVRLGTLLAQRDAEADSVWSRLGLPWITEQPRFDEERTSMYNLDEFLMLRAKPGVDMTHIAQCEFGAPTVQPTTLLGEKDPFDDAPKECRHPELTWTLRSTAETWRSAHPRLQGREWQIPTDSGLEPRTATAQGSREWLTKGAAVCPEALDRYFAIKLVKAASAHRRECRESGEAILDQKRDSGTGALAIEHTWKWVNKLRP